MKDGFIKVAAAAPAVRVADPGYNAGSILGCIKAAKEKGVKLLVTPELCLTGATCEHLFYQRTLTDAAVQGLKMILDATTGLDMLVFVGMPLAVGGRLYNVAAGIYGGDLLGFVPRTNTEGTVFSEPDDKLLNIELPGLYPVCVSTDLLFDNELISGLVVAVQFAADRRMPVSQAVRHASAGATVICELSDAPMGVYTSRNERNYIACESGKLHCGWLYAAPGVGESTTDKVYSGHCFVTDDGETLAYDESGSSLAVSELDVFNLVDARRREKTFRNSGEPHGMINWGMEAELTTLTRKLAREPFVPEENIADFCERALDIQVYGVMKRMEYTGCMKPVVGVSGGIDSTLVMIACAKALDKLGLPRTNLVGITMPCFGTTDRTKSNAIIIAEQLGADLRIIPIGESVAKHFEIIGHDMDDHSVVFENAQARERTMVLMNVANKVGGLDIGTKDLSEQADGWCTYNGDQMSNYDINAGLTKTMVRAVVKHYADNCEDKVLQASLMDVWNTPVTPELLPISDEGDLLQKSEDEVGPYILQDFFLWHMIMRGGSPEKVLRLAEHAFADEYDRETLIKWLHSYCRRFFKQQFKRSASADGPSVMGFTLSPRDGHKMPSDASDVLWLDAVERM